jgi:hypothetical protein
MKYPAGAPIRAKGTAPRPTIVLASAGSARTTRASSAGGAATMPTGRPVTTVRLTTCRPGARGFLLMNGRVMGSQPFHATASHRGREWARDHTGNGQREVHGHTGEGSGVGLHTDVRACRGVPGQSLHLSVATAEAMVNANGLPRN